MSIITRINTLFSQPDPKGLLGISIQQEALAICAVDEKNVIECQTDKVQKNSYLDAYKRIKNKHELTGQCHIVLSSQQNQLVQVDKPQVPHDEINAAVKWQIKDLVSIPPEDMIVDFFDGPTLAGGLEKINVVCASKNELSTLVEKINKDNCQIKSITVEEFAFASLAPIEDDARLMVCQQPNEEILLIIVKKGELFFQRRLRGMAKIALKSENELSMEVIDSLSLEIQRSTDYFERQLKQAPIRSIEIIVPMENEAYLARKLAENTNVAVNLFSMPEGFTQYREFAACIGATMLNYMKGVK
jgi:MSHA biogenesis protein MshI